MLFSYGQIHRFALDRFRTFVNALWLSPEVIYILGRTLPQQLLVRLEYQVSPKNKNCSLKKEYLVSPPYTHHIPANIHTQGTNRPWCMPAPPRLAKAIGFRLALTTSFVAPFTCDRHLHLLCTVNCFFALNAIIIVNRSVNLGYLDCRLFLYTSCDASITQRLQRSSLIALTTVSSSGICGYAHVGLPICPEQFSIVFDTDIAAPITPLPLSGSERVSYLTS